jgi:hypothetical protein
MGWLYKTVKVNVSFFGNKLDESKCDAMFNALGEDGWELISVIPKAGPWEGKTEEIIAFFKKQTSLPLSAVPKDENSCLDVDRVLNRGIKPLQDVSDEEVTQWLSSSKSHNQVPPMPPKPTSMDKPTK